MKEKLRFVFLGLTISSSWGNGHATTYRALVAELAARGHHVLFLERDMPWYAASRDARAPAGCRLALYRSVPDLRRRFEDEIRDADAVIVGSYVPEGVAVGWWVTAVARGVTAFYDIDTPVTLAKLRRRDHEYLTPALLRAFDLYLSFTGGPTLTKLEDELGARRACSFHCSVNPRRHRPVRVARRWDLGYLGTYSPDRQPVLDELLVAPARVSTRRRFAVAGPSYPAEIVWPRNVERIEHLPPKAHPSFYCAQRFTLNVTRADMVRAGWSPSVRIFEAAACGTPIVSDWWEGLDQFLDPGREVLVAESADDVLRHLKETTETARREIAERARRRVLSAHTAAHRARQLERLVLDARPARRERSATVSATRPANRKDRRAALVAAGRS